MKRGGFAIAFSLLAVGACTQKDSEELATGTITVDDMPAYCKEKASMEYGVESDGIEMLTVESRGGVHTLAGSYTLGDAKHPFQCQFDPDGNFISIIPI